MSKGKKILNYSLMAVLSLGSLSLNSCKKDKEVTLQAYQNVNLHLANFSLSKEIKEKGKDGKDVLKLDKTIASAFFSIENAKGEGVLTNIKPLPFGTNLNDVRLGLMPMMEGVKLEVSLDAGATFQEWKASDKKTFNLSPSSDKLKIRLSMPTSVQGGETYTYTYKVLVQVYKFDPQTIHWSELTTPASDVLGSNKFASYTLADGQMNLMTIDEGGKANKFYQFKPATSSFDVLTYPSLPNATYIKGIKNYKNEVFALASDNKVYRFKEQKTWEALDLEAKALLGVFAPRKEGAEPSLALLVQEGEKSYFASYDVAKKNLTRGEELSSDFPTSDYKTLSEFNAQVGATLTLTFANGITYTSTNGTAWAKVSMADDELDKSFAFVENGGLLYRFVANAEGLELFTKENAQSPWVKNGDVALKPAEGKSFEARSFANSPIAIWVDGQVFYLYRGGSNPKLYKGDLKKNAV